MPRPPGVFYDDRAKCWATNGLGEVRSAKTGRRYRPRTYFRECSDPKKDKRRAEALLAEAIEKESDRAALRSAGDPPMVDVVQWYLGEAERELTRETYQRRVEQLATCLDWPGPDHVYRIGNLVARNVAVDDIRPLLKALIERGCSEAYVTRSILMAIKRVFAWACEVRAGTYPGLPLPSNPLARLKGPSSPRRAHRDADPVAVSRLIRWGWRRASKLSGLHQRFAKLSVLLLLALRETGARPKELCVASWDELQVLPDGWGLIRLPWWKHKTGRKTKKERLIAVPPAVVRRLEWIKGLDGCHPYHIFTHRRGGKARKSGTAEAGVPWVAVEGDKKAIGDTTTLRRWFNGFKRQARAEGVELPAGFRLYWLRSAYSTDAQRKGVPRALLAEAMGTSEEMLDRNYTDLDASDVMRAAREARG